MTEHTEQAAAALGARDGLDDFRYYVGRKQLALELQGCVRGTGNGWIHGARRIGKTSSAQALMKAARELGSVTIFVNASDLPESGFSELLERVLAGAPRSLVSRDGSAKERFEKLQRTAKKKKKPVLIVIDEFDHVAPNLRLEEQAFLRRLAGDYKPFRYLFISRLNPKVLVEDVAVDRSRLLGVCKISKIRPLELRDVRELLKLVSRDFDCPQMETLADRIWGAVGGHTTSVITLVHAAAAVIGSGGTFDSVLSHFDQARSEVDSYMTGFWRDLRPGTRLALLGLEAVDIAQSALDDAAVDGLSSDSGPIQRPSWLVERGRTLGSNPFVIGVDSGSPLRFALVEQLHSLIASANARWKRRTGRACFEHTDETLKYVCLLRETRDEDDLRLAVDHLYKVVWEAVRTPKKEWRFPEALARSFKSSEGIQQVVALRNFFFHDPDAAGVSDEDNWRYKNQAEVYRLHCGTNEPSGPQWAMLRDGLLKTIVDTVSSLDQALAREVTPVE